MLVSEGRICINQLGGHGEVTSHSIRVLLAQGLQFIACGSGKIASGDLLRNLRCPLARLIVPMRTVGALRAIRATPLRRAPPVRGTTAAIRRTTTAVRGTTTAIRRVSTAGCALSGAARAV
ncbi:hypothetical protein GCM10010459_12030 [Microbacterium schleiferi]